MKPNIYKDTCHIVIHSPEHCEAVQKRLFELGFGWPEKVVQYTNAAGLQLNYDHPGQLMWNCTKNYLPPKPHHVITLDDLYLAKPREISVPLNAGHTAVVSKDGITVGCQKFPLSIIGALVKAMGELEGGGE